MDVRLGAQPALSQGSDVVNKVLTPIECEAVGLQQLCVPIQLEARSCLCILWGLVPRLFKAKALIQVVRQSTTNHPNNNMAGEGSTGSQYEYQEYGIALGVLSEPFERSIMSEKRELGVHGKQKQRGSLQRLYQSIMT